MRKNCLVNVSSMLLLLMLLSACSLMICSGSDVHDVAVVDVTVYPTKVLAGSTVTIDAVVENQGTSYETFNITAYFDNHTIQTLTVTELAPGLNTTLTFNWKVIQFKLLIFPSPWPKEPDEIMTESCTIKVEADIVPDEIDAHDNVHIDGTVTVIWSRIDPNGDGIVDIFDVVKLAKAFGVPPVHPDWDPAWDFDSNGEIDIYDVVTMVKRFGMDYTWMDP